eukprot:773640-Rhodomonas_salina.1
MIVSRAAPAHILRVRVCSPPSKSSRLTQRPQTRPRPNLHLIHGMAGKGAFQLTRRTSSRPALKMAHIVDAANCLSAHWAAMAEHSKKSGLTFKSKLENWTSEAEIKILTDLMEKRDAGR